MIHASRRLAVLLNGHTRCRRHQAFLSESCKPAKGERIGVIVCGANTPLATFNELLATA